jgi:hypothetical protein
MATDSNAHAVRNMGITPVKRKKERNTTRTEVALAQEGRTKDGLGNGHEKLPKQVVESIFATDVRRHLTISSPDHERRLYGGS